jgi:hypothetical protein
VQGRDPSIAFNGIQEATMSIANDILSWPERRKPVKRAARSDPPPQRRPQETALAKAIARRKARRPRQASHE